MKNKKIIIAVVIVLLAGIISLLIYSLYPRSVGEMLPSDVSRVSVSVTEMGVRNGESYHDSVEKKYEKSDTTLSEILELLDQTSARLAINDESSEKYSGRYWSMLIETESGAFYHLYGLGNIVCLSEFPSDGDGEYYKLYGCEKFLDEIFGIVARD